MTVAFTPALPSLTDGDRNSDIYSEDIPVGFGDSTGLWAVEWTRKDTVICSLRSVFYCLRLIIDGLRKFTNS